MARSSDAVFRNGGTGVAPAHRPGQSGRSGSKREGFDLLIKRFVCQAVLQNFADHGRVPFRPPAIGCCRYYSLESFAAAFDSEMSRLYASFISRATSRNACASMER